MSSKHILRRNRSRLANWVVTGLPYGPVLVLVRATKHVGTILVPDFGTCLGRSSSEWLIDSLSF